MKRIYICVLSFSMLSWAFSVVPHVSAAQWIIASSDGILRDYTQGAGTSVNPRSISPSLAASIVSGIDFGPNGNLYVLATFPSNGLFRVNPATGASTLIGSTGLSNVIEGDVGYDPTTGAALYGLWNGSGGNQFFTLNTTTGAASVIGTIVGDDLSGLAFDNSGQMWVIDSQVNTSHVPNLLKVNKANGSIISTQSTGLPSTSPSPLLGADFDSTTNQLYFAYGNGSFYNVNTATGLATLVGPHGVSGATGLAFVLVPEPGLIGLVLSGSAAAVGFAPRLQRRRRVGVGPS